MTENTLDCYVLPAQPLPLLLPVECVAAVVARPEIDTLSEAPASWMHGYVNWENQLVPVLSYSSLQDSTLDESKKRKSRMVVLNPIPNSARKAFAGLLVFGDVKQINVDADTVYDELPEKVDRRYVDAVLRIGTQCFIVPNLAALGVAFSYF